MKTLLFNPFEKYSDKTLMLFGFLFSLLGAFLGYFFNVRFDGVLDLHFVEKVTIYQPVLDIGIDITCSSTILFLVGKQINNKTRFIDILSASMIARTPLYCITFFNADNFIYNSTQKMLAMVEPGKIENLDVWDMLVIIIFALITILFLIWCIVLLFNGFKIATNAKGTKHTLLFILEITLAEILSKTLIFTLN
jgi:hypothetical protein